MQHPTPSLTRDRDDDPGVIVTPARTATHVHTPLPPGALLDNAAQLEQLATSYDQHYDDTTATFGELTDANERLFAHRTAVTQDAFDTFDEHMRAAKLAKAQCSDKDEINRLIEKLDSLSDEKQRLLLRMDEANEYTNRLIDEKESCESIISQLSDKHEKLHAFQTKTLPTQTFIRKLLKGVSNATIHKKNDPGAISGFIVKNASKDLMPFECTSYNPSYKQVNDIWEVILR